MARIDPNSAKAGFPARPAKEYSQELHHLTLDTKGIAGDVLTPSVNQIPVGLRKPKVTRSAPGVTKTIKEKSTRVLDTLGKHIKKFLKG